MASCRPAPVAERVMYVSIAPLKGIVEGIVGEDFEVKVLVPAGASPELFEPTPRQVAELGASRLVFGIGLIDFERALLERLGDDAKMVNLSEGIVPIAGTCSHTHHGRHCAHGIDPHVWCSPRQLLKMAENAYCAIATEMPDSAKYAENYAVLQQSLAQLDKEVAQICATAEVRRFLIFHPALSYLARDYSLEQIAIEREGKETSARHLAEIITAARAEGVTKVFYQSEFPRSSVEAICVDIGAEAVEINPLAEDAQSNILEITRLITTR